MSEKEKELQSQPCECNDEECNCDTITLELEDGTSQEFILLDTLKQGKKNYIALAPLDTDEYFIYGYKEIGEYVEFFSLDEDKEFDKVAAIFEKRFAEEEEGE